MKKIYTKIWNLAKPYYEKGRPSDVYHIEGMMKAAMLVCKNEKIDDTLLLPLVILHDVGYAEADIAYFEKNKKKAHMIAGAKIAEKILNKVGYSSRKTKKITEWILIHDNWIFGKNDQYNQDKILGTFSDLDFTWMASRLGFEHVKKILKKNTKEMIVYLEKNEKLKKRPFRTKITKKIFQDALNERKMTIKQRCKWAEKEFMHEYHDKEWGVPVHDDRKLFEMLILEGAQAGLSWSTILARQKTYRNAFDNFNAEKIAKYNSAKTKELLQDKGIIRNKLKIESAITNAKAFLGVKKEFGTFNKYIWSFVNNKPIINKFKNLKQIPAKTKISDKISKDLKERGFKFVGSTICYAFMQAVGMVNDHEVSCFRYKKLS